MRILCFKYGKNDQGARFRFSQLGAGRDHLGDGLLAGAGIAAGKNDNIILL